MWAGFDQWVEAKPWQAELVGSRSPSRSMLPDAREVYVCGSFNDWAPDKTPLDRGQNGWWVAQLILAPGAYEYRFRVDGEWVDDPAAERRVPNPFGTSNCVREV